MNYVFKIHTPFHAFLVHRMADTLRREGAAGSTPTRIALLAERPSLDGLMIPPGLYDQIVLLPIVGGSAVGRGAAKRANAALRIVREAAGPQPATIFLSDIAWPLNNAIFFDRVLARRCRFGMFTDGLAHYVPYDVRPRFFLRSLLKTAIGSVALGVRYRPWHGHVTGSDHPRLEVVHGLGAHQLIAPTDKRREIPVPRPVRPVSDGKRKLLFLCQGFGNRILSRERTEIVAWSIAAARSIDADEYYFKPHPMDVVEGLEAFDRAGFIRIDEISPVEALYERRFFDVVVSHYTASLLNLKILYGDAVTCLALAPDVLADRASHRPRGRRDHEALFRANDIGIVRDLLAEIPSMPRSVGPDDATNVASHQRAAARRTLRGGV